MSELVVLTTAFRLFFFVSGLLAAVWIPLWMVVLRGDVQIQSDLGLVGWHAHEMSFGYMGAVLAGFLLTAARNWTKRPTISGVPLAALVALWIAGRVLGLVSASLPMLVPAAVDAFFFAGLALAIARPIALAKSRRNVVFPLLIAGVGLCDVMLHVYGSHSAVGDRALRSALIATALVILIFGGRVVPMFTRNATSWPVRERGFLDRLGVASAVILLLATVVDPAHAVTQVLALVAGVCNAARLVGWRGSHTLRSPILWVLHLGWLLVAAGLAAIGAAGFTSGVSASMATHVLTVGGFGVMTLGMMARVSLGHTGRKLTVPRLVAVAFALVTLSMVGRVLAPKFVSAFEPVLWSAAAAWSLGFAMFTARYAVVLLTPRVDGKPG